jgi:hypothetical protein
LGTMQGPDACRQSPRISTRAQDAIPDPQRTQVVTENLFQDFPRLFPSRLVFPLRFLVSETSHTSVYLLRVSCLPHLYFSISLASFRAWMDPTSKKEGHCDIIAHTVLLYYCTYYSVSLTCTVRCVHCTIDIDTLYVLYMFPVSLFPTLRFHLQHLFTTLCHIHILLHCT